LLPEQAQHQRSPPSEQREERRAAEGKAQHSARTRQGGIIVTAKIVRSIVQAMSDQKERLIAAAIRRRAGTITLEESASRGEILALPDGTEKFVFDDEELIHFLAPTLQTQNYILSGDMSIRFERPYRLLYAQDGEE